MLYFLLNSFLVLLTGKHGPAGSKGRTRPRGKSLLSLFNVSCGKKRVEISQIGTEASAVSITIPSPVCCSGVLTERPLICKVNAAPNIISGSSRLQGDNTGGKSRKICFRGRFECAAAAGGAHLVNTMSLSVCENKGSNFKHNQESRAGRL